jgi:hypothetical protein
MAVATVTMLSALDVAPLSSIAVRRTLKAPAALGVALTLAPSSAPSSAVTMPPPDNKDQA